jgi:hypothetical protein
MRHTLAVIALTIASTNVALAEHIYKWQDSSGTTHFSALPPNGVSSVQVSTRLAHVIGAPAPIALPKLDSQKAEDEQRAIDDRVKQEVAKQESRRTTFCTTLRTDLSHLRNNPRVRIQDGNQMRRLTEDERQGRIKAAEQRINNDCV